MTGSYLARHRPICAVLTDIRERAVAHDDTITILLADEATKYAQAMSAKLIEYSNAKLVANSSGNQPAVASCPTGAVADQPAVINLVLSRMGIDDAINLANQRGIILGNLRLSQYKEVLAEANEQYLQKIIQWYSEDMRLLLYSKKDQ